VNRAAALGYEVLGYCGEVCSGLHDAKMSRAVPTLAQVYEDHAADFTRAAEQTDDPVFRNMLLTLALQWRLAAREEAAMPPIQPKMADGAC
jgi:hypothetical protein